MAKKILILGITASGKSSLAFELAKKLQTDIVSIDSMKVYRRMNIGTAKPTAAEQRQVKYHIIDVVQPSQSFGVDKFLMHSQQVFAQLSADNKPILAEGGTAMYIKALLYGIFDGPGNDTAVRENLRCQIATDGLLALHKQLQAADPIAAERIHPNDEKRIIRALEVFRLTGKPISSFQNQFDAPAPNDWLIIGLRREKELESRRINSRVKIMIENGLVDEVKALLAEKEPLSSQAASAIGYAEIITHLKHNIPIADSIEQIKINTRKLAKAQRTWFKRFENVNWFNLNENTESVELLDDILHLISQAQAEK